MRVISRTLVVTVLAAAAALTACTGAVAERTPAGIETTAVSAAPAIAATPGSPATAPPAREAQQSGLRVELSDAERAAAEATLQLYFTAVIQHNRAWTAYLWDTNPAGRRPDALPGGTVPPLAATLDRTLMIEGQVLSYWAVEVDMGPEQIETYSPGENRRWVTLVRRAPDRPWKIVSLATGPLMP